MAVRWRQGSIAISTTIRLLIEIGILAALVMVVLAVFRVGFAVRFWRKMWIVAFTYIAIILLLAFVRGFGLV